MLKRMDNRFMKVLEVILTCRILHNFRQVAGEEFDDQEILKRVIIIEREYLQMSTCCTKSSSPSCLPSSRKLLIMVVLAIQFVCYSRNTTVHCFFVTKANA